MIENRKYLETSDDRKTVLDCIESGIEEVLPSNIVDEKIDVRDRKLEIEGISGRESRGKELELDFENLFLVGGGKGSSLLAQELGKEIESTDSITGGVVVDSEPVDVEVENIETVEGGHPVPSEGSLKGGSKILDYSHKADEDDLLVVVITGGGSSLMASPVEGIGLEELRETNESLVKSGASIHEINSLRKHISKIKGGRLAEDAHPARVVSIIVSDVVGDDTNVIASGPTSPDPSTYDDATEVVSRYKLDLPRKIVKHLERGTDRKIPETPKPDDEFFEKVSNHVVANNYDAAESAVRQARRHGFEACFLSSYIEGGAARVGKFHTSVVKEIVSSGNPVKPPCVVVSGGETTVSVDENNTGRGGPNQEFVLSTLLELDDSGTENVTVGAVDTDGIDGQSKFAGGICDLDDLICSRESSEENKRRGEESLEKHNTEEFFRENGGIKTGWTGTNVSDLRVILVSE